MMGQGLGCLLYTSEHKIHVQDWNINQRERTKLLRFGYVIGLLAENKERLDKVLISMEELLEKEFSLQIYKKTTKWGQRKGSGWIHYFRSCTAKGLSLIHIFLMV